MPTNTANYNLVKPGTDEFYDVSVHNGNSDIIDAKLKENADGLTTHLEEKASLTEVGHVQLSNATDSTSELLAATPKAVKAAYDRADAAFTSASNGKIAVRNAITGVDPNVVIPTDPTFQQLADSIGQISTGALSELLSGNGRIYYSDVSVLSSGTTYVKKREIKALFGGAARISFTLRSQAGAASYGQIYINGLPVGIERSTTSTLSPGVEFSEDISFQKNDLIQLYLKQSSGSNFTSNTFSIGVDTSSVFQTIL